MGCLQLFKNQFIDTEIPWIMIYVKRKVETASGIRSLSCFQETTSFLGLFLIKLGETTSTVNIIINQLLAVV